MVLSGLIVAEKLNMVASPTGILCDAGLRLFCLIIPFAYPRVNLSALLLYKNGLMPTGRPIGQEKSLYIREYRLGVNVCYVLKSSRDNQSTTYRKAHEWIRCVRSGHSEKLVEIRFFLRL